MQIVKTLELYEPHEKQIEFHESPKRFRVAALGRQAGKSTMANFELASKAWINPGHRFWFVSPVYSQAKDQYRTMLRFLPPEVIHKKSDTELRIEFITGSIVEYKSGEVLHRLRGAALHGVIIDEVRDQDPDLWRMVIRPMLTTTQGWAAFISTPNGFDAFSDLFEMAKTSTDWHSIQAPSTCNPMITDEEIESSLSVMTEDEFAQEILAEFREIGKGKAYKSHGVWNQVSQNPFAVNGLPWSPYIPILVGLDFNVGLMAWELGQQKAGDFHFEMEIAVENTDTQEMATLLAEKVKGHRPGVILVGDATGNANKTSAVGKTDYSIIESTLRAHGIRFDNYTPKENPLVKDRLNMVNSRLKAADGSVHLTYNFKNCPRLKKDFERVTVKPGTAGFALDKKNILLTQASDAASYPICYYSDEWKAKPGIMRIIHRG